MIAYEISNTAITLVLRCPIRNVFDRASLSLIRYQSFVFLEIFAGVEPCLSADVEKKWEVGDYKACSVAEAAGD